MIKTCFKCKQEKPVSEFYHHPAMGDGYLGKCKACTRKDNIENRKKKVEYYRKFDRQRSVLPDRKNAMHEYQKQHPEKYLQYKKRSHAKYPEKKRASQLVNNAVRNGRLIKLPCEVCGKTENIHGHHEDYSKPLEVVWLCAKCHSDEHKRLRKLEKVKCLIF